MVAHHDLHSVASGMHSLDGFYAEHIIRRFNGTSQEHERPRPCPGVCDLWRTFLVADLPDGLGVAPAIQGICRMTALGGHKTAFLGNEKSGREYRSIDNSAASTKSVRPSRIKSDTTFPVAGECITPWPLKPFAR